MPNIRKSSLEFFANQDIQRYLKEVIKPVGLLIYNEIYVYILFICMYNVFLLFLTLANLFLLLQVLKKQDGSIFGLCGSHSIRLD